MNPLAIAVTGNGLTCVMIAATAAVLIAAITGVVPRLFTLSALRLILRNPGPATQAAELLKALLPDQPKLLPGAHHDTPLSMQQE